MTKRLTFLVRRGEDCDFINITVPDVDAHDVMALKNTVSYWLHAVEGYFPGAEITVQTDERYVRAGTVTSQNVRERARGVQGKARKPPRVAPTEVR
jgi:hypothetical protein